MEGMVVILMWTKNFSVSYIWMKIYEVCKYILKLTSMTVLWRVLAKHLYTYKSSCGWYQDVELRFRECK
jgi:hypothetical protein